MEIPVTGVVILAVAAWLFLFWPRLLYAATIVSIPFSATAVINFAWAGGPYGTDKSVIAWQFFAVLWISREALSQLPQWHRHGWFLTCRPRLRLLVFLAAVVASLCVPMILNGTSWVDSFLTSGQYDYRARVAVPVRFTFFNLTQSAYLFFGVLTAIVVAAKNCHPKRVFYTLRLYVGSCVFAAGWGLFQLWCHITGRIYPAYVFNTGTNASTLGYAETLSAGALLVGRISSVATEPSVLAQELLVAFVVLIVCLGLRLALFPPRWNWFATILIGAALLMSTSTTAYSGTFAALLLAGVALARTGSRRWKYYPLIALVGVGAGMVLMKKVQLVAILAQGDILNKYQTFSGMARLNSVELAAQAFLRYPILGAGWGAVTTADLIFLILANTGLIGGIALGAFLLPALRGLWRLAAVRNLSAAVLLPSVALWLLLVEGADFSVPIGYSWLLLGLAAGVVAAAETEPCLETAKQFVHTGVTAR